MDFEAGYMYRDKSAFFASVSIDTSVLFAAGVLLLYGQAEENTKKVKPDYKDSLPPETRKPPAINVPPVLPPLQSGK